MYNSGMLEYVFATIRRQ